jgi:chemotaxis-related protein WspD
VKPQTTFQIHIDDCWNRVGISTDNRCDQLREVVHCRNCSKYHDAARTLMQRPVQEDYRQQWTKHFAQEQNAGRVAQESAFIFRIGHEWLALATRALVTVAEKTVAHRLPHCNAPALLGVVNVGGKLYPCISLAELMKIDVNSRYIQPGRHVFPRLIVVQIGTQAVALPVDDVHGIERYGSDDLRAPPSTISQDVSCYLSGVLGLRDKQSGYLDADLLGSRIAEVLR